MNQLERPYLAEIATLRTLVDRMSGVIAGDATRAVAMWQNLIGAGWDNPDCRAEAKEATNDLEQAIDEITFEVKVTLRAWNPTRKED